MDWLNEINKFESFSEYRRFVKYIADRISENEIEEIEPKEYFSGRVEGLENDRWFKDKSSDDIWRLIPPDFPFQVFFRKVKYPLDKAVNR
jgi:hypothetical protein